MSVAVIIITNRRPSQQQQKIMTINFMTINLDYQGNRRMPDACYAGNIGGRDGSSGDEVYWG